MKNRFLRQTLFSGLMALSLLSAWPLQALSQNTPWPSKPVRIVVPFPAGGSTDLVARFIAQGLSDKFGQQFIVDNRAGGGGTVSVVSPRTTGGRKSSSRVGLSGSDRTAWASPERITCTWPCFSSIVPPVTPAMRTLPLLRPNPSQT